MSTRRRQRRAAPQRVARRKLAAYRAKRNAAGALRGRELDEWFLPDPATHLGEPEAHWRDTYDGRLRWGRRDRGCPCCEDFRGFGFGFSHPQGQVALELAALELLHEDGAADAAAALARYRGACAEFRIHDRFERVFAELPRSASDEGPLSDADERVLAWYAELFARSPEAHFAAVAAQPRERAAFGRLRERVVSSMETAPLALRRFDFDFDVERAALLGLLTFPLWRRSLADWPGGSGAELLRFVLAPRIEMPALFAAVMDDAYEGPRVRLDELGRACVDPGLVFDPLLWIVAEAQGASVRRIARAFGVKVPTALVAAACGLPDAEHLDSDHARAIDMNAVLDRAEVQRLGGSDVEWRRLRRYVRLRQATGRDAVFARSALAFLVRHRDALDDDGAQRALDWGTHRFTQDAQFSFAKRSLRAVLEQTAAYEREIELAARAARAAERARVRRWDVRGFALSWRDDDGVAWSVRELTDELALVEEGAAQRHCVGVYAAACLAGRAVIAQLRREGARVVTIEVTPADRRVVQARGRFNASPSAEAMAALRHWAAHCGLALPERT